MDTNTKGVLYGSNVEISQDEPEPEPTDFAEPEKSLWCHVIKRLHGDIIEVMQFCNKGKLKGCYDGIKMEFFYERQKYLRYIYSKDFELVCENANVCHQAFSFKFRELLQLEV